MKKGRFGFGMSCTMTLVALLALSAVLQAEPYDLEFCSFLGGSQWERVQAVFVDANGYIYVGGSTKSPDFPTTRGAYDNSGSRNGSNDGFVSKIAPDGTRVIWSTYLHGTARDDVYGIYADSGGFVYAVGWTVSSDFPTTAGAHDRTHNGRNDVLVTKFTPDGRSLVYSTFLGGSGIDQCRGGMAFDEEGAIYLSGYTDSTNLPTTEGAIQRSFKGGYGDAFVAKLSADGASLLFCTYLGSTGPDHAFPGLQLHSDGSIVVTGLAGAADFPATSGAYQSIFAGTQIRDIWYGDAFIARFSLTANHEALIHYVTFLGGSGVEVSTAQHGIALDQEGNVVVSGTTDSVDFPTTPGAFQPALNSGNNLYIAKLSLDGTTLLASTYLGGSAKGYEVSGLCLDPNANVLVSGSIFGGVTDHPVTTDAFSPTSGGLDEAFFAVLSPDMSVLRYSSHFGGEGNDRIRDLARSAAGDLVFGGDTYSTNLPITDAAFQKNYAGAGDAYIARFKPAIVSPVR